MFIIQIEDILNLAIDIIKNCFCLKNADDQEELEYYFNKIKKSVVALTDLCWKD